MLKVTDRKKQKRPYSAEAKWDKNGDETDCLSPQTLSFMEIESIIQRKHEAKEIETILSKQIAFLSGTRRSGFTYKIKLLHLSRYFLLS